VGENNGWQEHKLLVMAELKGLRSDHKELRKEMKCVGNEIIRLKTRSTFWGGVAGSIPVGAMLIWEYLTGRS